MVDEGRWRIETFAHHAEGNDLSIREGVIYSDRPPGTAILAAPWYLVGRILPPPIRPMVARYDEGHPPLAYLLMFPPMVGAATVVLIYGLLRRGYNLSEFAAVMASTALALGTTLWKYGSVLYSHAPSALLILAGVILAISIVRAQRIRILQGALLGTVLGASVVVEYSNAIYVAIVAIYLTFGVGRRLAQNLPAIAAMGIAGALPITFLLIYNSVNFGSPFTTSYNYAINYPWAVSFATTFDMALIRGLAGVLWYGVDLANQSNQGLLRLMPILMIGAAGIWPYIRRRRAEALFVLGLLAVYLLLFAKHHTFSGFTMDTRYLAPFLPLWMIPVGFTFEQIREWEKRRENPAVSAMMWLIVYGMLFLSIRNMISHIGFSYSYHLDPALLLQRASTPENWGYIFGTVFVNWRNLPLLWAVEIALGGLTAVGWWVAEQRGFHMGRRGDLSASSAYESPPDVL
jgi:hypothetical protein